MRWPFRRETPVSGPAAAGGEAAPPPAPAARPQAWRELAPLRTLDPVQLTTDGVAFSRGLGVRQRPAMALAPLGHDLLLDAPRGIVSGIAHTVAASDRVGELPVVPTARPQEASAGAPRRRPLPVQAAVEGPAPAARTPEPLPAPPAAVSTLGEIAPATATTAAVAGAAPAVQVAAPSPTLAPGRRPLAAVARPPLPAPVRGASRPVAPRPVPVVQRAVAEAMRPPASAPAPPVEALAAVDSSEPQLVSLPELRAGPPIVEAVASEQPAEATPAASLPLVGERRTQPAEAPTPVPSPASVPPAPAVAASPAPPPPAPVARRQGLGAPIVREPGLFPEPARVTAVPPVPGATPVERAPVAAQRAERGAPAPAPPMAAPLPGSDPTPAPVMPALAEAPPAQTPQMPFPPAEPARVAPLVGEVELAPAAERGRPAEQVVAAADPGRPAEPSWIPVAAPPASTPAVVRGLTSSPARGIQRLAEPAPAAPAAPRADAPLPVVPLTPRPALAEAPRVAGAATAPLVGSLAPGRPAESALSTLVAPAPQATMPEPRRLAWVPGATSTLGPLVAQPELARAATDRPVAAPGERPGPARVPAQFPLAPAARPAAAPQQGPPPFVRPVQREIVIPEIQVAPDAAQPDPAPAPSSPPAPTPAAVATGQSATVAAPGPSSGHAPATAANAAQDAERLREQVLHWVRAELLVNRERAGRLTDLR